MCRLSWNLGTSTCWNPQGLPRPVMGLLYLFCIEAISFTLLFLELMIRQKALRVANMAVGNPCWSNHISNCSKQILLWRCGSVSGVAEDSLVRVVSLCAAQLAIKPHTLEDSKLQPAPEKLKDRTTEKTTGLRQLAVWQLTLSFLSKDVVLFSSLSCAQNFGTERNCKRRSCVGATS